MIALGTLAEEAWIATASGRCNCLPTVTTACARAGFAPRFAVEADEFASTLGFIAAGLGIAMVPMLALNSIPENVRVLRLRGEEPKRRVYAVTRRESSDLPTVSAMRAALCLSADAYRANAS